MCCCALNFPCLSHVLKLTLNSHWFIVWVWGGAISLTDQWETEGVIKWRNSFLHFCLVMLVKQKYHTATLKDFFLWFWHFMCVFETTVTNIMVYPIRICLQNTRSRSLFPVFYQFLFFPFFHFSSQDNENNKWKFSAGWESEAPLGKSTSSI